MYFKIFRIGLPTCDSVLAQVYRDEEGNDFVRITAWHTADEDVELIQVEEVHFGDSDDVLQKCKMFVANMTQAYAAEIATNFKI